MFCAFSNPAIRRFMMRFLACMLAYAMTLVLSFWVFVRFHPTGILAWVLAVFPALAIVAQIVACGMYLAEEKDEFVRNVLVQSMIWGIGATLAVTTTWGFLEGFVHIRHLDPTLVYPLFWALTGISYGGIKMRYR